ncbi:MAG: hypothetical protein QXM17_05070 [Metallosphaera sp.]
MQVFRYSIANGELYPDDNGEVLVFVEGQHLLIKYMGRELNDVKFHLTIKERALLEKVKMISRSTGIEVDPTPALAYPGKSRTLMLNKLMGQIFEEFVYRILANKFQVQRQVKAFESLYNFTHRRYHNTPDILVEGRIPVEAKVSFYNYEQISEYSKKYRVGAVVLAYSSNCYVPSGWRYFTNFLADQRHLLNWLDSVLHA